MSTPSCVRNDRETRWTVGMAADYCERSLFVCPYPSPSLPISFSLSLPLYLYDPERRAGPTRMVNEEALGPGARGRALGAEAGAPRDCKEGSQMRQLSRVKVKEGGRRAPSSGGGVVGRRAARKSCGHLCGYGRMRARARVIVISRRSGCGFVWCSSSGTVAAVNKASATASASLLTLAELQGHRGPQMRPLQIVGKITKIVGFANHFAHPKTMASNVGTRTNVYYQIMMSGRKSKMALDCQEIQANSRPRHQEYFSKACPRARYL